MRDVNDKPPRLTPPAQRASVSADAAPGRLLLRLAAADADASGAAALRFARAPLPVRAVDSGGNEVRVAGSGSDPVFVSSANICFAI